MPEILKTKRIRFPRKTRGVSGSPLYVEFTSNIFGFVDDVEFLFDDGEKVIHVRSASRLGFSDLGVNRKRVEEIRKEFLATDKHG